MRNVVAVIAMLFAAMLAAAFFLWVDHTTVPLAYWMVGSLTWFTLVGLFAFLIEHPGREQTLPSDCPQAN